MTTLLPGFALKRAARAVEYRRLAEVSDAQVEATLLPQVREKHELAAARWRALAALDERPGEADPLAFTPAEAAQPESE
jgi:hypothetical protein